MLYRKMFTALMLALTFMSFTIANGQDKESGKGKIKTETQENQKLNEEKATVKPWNELCPVKGGKVQKETSLVEHNEKQYGFCCGGCDKEFSKDPEKFSKNLSENGTEFIGKK